MERRTALIAEELRNYDIDIAGLSETRLPDESQREEVHILLEWKSRKQQASVRSRIRNEDINSKKILVQFQRE